MKIYEICFSPTGGTKKVSSLLTSALEGESVLVDLTNSQADFHSIALTEEDVAVISVPSYAGRVPAVAAERDNSLALTLAKEPVKSLLRIGV